MRLQQNVAKAVELAPRVGFVSPAVHPEDDRAREKHTNVSDALPSEAEAGPSNAAAYVPRSAPSWFIPRSRNATADLPLPVLFQEDAQRFTNDHLANNVLDEARRQRLLHAGRPENYFEHSSGAAFLNKRAAKSLWTVVVFFLTNAILALALFVWPSYTEYKYWYGRPALGEAERLTHGAYLLDSIGFSIWAGVDVLLNVNDLGVGVAATENYVRAYTQKVFTPSDRPDLGWPGWQLQDILDLPRVSDAADRFVDPSTGNAMIQDYRLCASGCLQNGLPQDWPGSSAGRGTRKYGEFGDIYVRQDVFYSWLDPDFVRAVGTPDADRYDHFGLGSGVALSDRIKTTPTTLSYICNLGRRRRKTRQITIKSTGCHVSVRAAPGRAYKLYVRQRNTDGRTVTISQPVTLQENGCESSDIEVDVRNPRCERVLTPGQGIECFYECSVVLYKGVDARPVPVSVQASEADDDPITHVRVNDKYLHMSRLTVSGANADVALSDANIATVDVATRMGETRLTNLRYDVANIQSETDDVVLEDDRNTELQYRSAADFLCLAAPMIEDVPQQSCQMRYQPITTPYQQATPPSAHEFYDTTPDGYITRQEFLDGLEAAGLTFDGDSLDLDPTQQASLLDHVFSQAVPDAAVQELPYELFQEQLERVAPFFTTLYDSSAKRACFDGCMSNAGALASQCQQQCTWRCVQGGIGITEATYGLCDPVRSCARACGNPDGAAASTLDYHYFDLDPPDGKVTYEEFRQAILKVFGNCTYVVEPFEKDYTTCKYVGGGLYQTQMAGELRRQCQRYSAQERIAAGLPPYDDNPDDWRVNNEAMPIEPAVYSMYGKGTGSTTAPRECRPFPDYDPALSGIAYDPSVTVEQCEACFLADGVTRVPPHYYDRATWSQENYINVMSQLRATFSDSNYRPGNPRYFPYFNMTDDDQFRTLASKLFSQVTVRTRVPYSVFNDNLATANFIDGVGDKLYLLNPRCYQGKFLKVQPEDYNTVTQEEIDSSIKIRYRNNSTSVVEAFNMPGYGGEPCGPDYGSGVPGSTTFTRFAWADQASGIGYKWGRALPVFCLDEAWPSGGVNGSYPMLGRYGKLAGERVLPGCVPRSCKPKLVVDLMAGALHAQVLPFDMDAWNERGRYLRMVEACRDSDGVSQCFVQGYGQEFETRVRHQDRDMLLALAADHGAADQPDALAIAKVTGAGIPTHKRWFWTTRPTYMSVEPAYLAVFSAGVLKPRIRDFDMKFTPGVCQAAYGAVEHIDWRDNRTVGGSSDNPMQSLRKQREATVFGVLSEALTVPGAVTYRGLLVLKELWRTSYSKEALMFSSITADPETDTAAGYFNDDGALVDVGPHFRHDRVCTGADCSKSFVTYLRNCLSPEQRGLSSDGALEACAEYTDFDLGPQSPAVNETVYWQQFPRASSDYSWRELCSIKPESLVDRLPIIEPLMVEVDPTKAYTQRWTAHVTSAGHIGFRDASSAWRENVPLLICIVLSALIGAMCGFVALVYGTYVSIKLLIKYNHKLATDRKMAHAKLEKRWKAYLDAVEIDYHKEIEDGQTKHEGLQELLRPDAGVTSRVLRNRFHNLSAVRHAHAVAFAKMKGWIELQEFASSSDVDNFTMIDSLNPGRLKQQYEKLLEDWKARLEETTEDSLTAPLPDIVGPLGKRYWPPEEAEQHRDGFLGLLEANRSKILTALRGADHGTQQDTLVLISSPQQPQVEHEKADEAMAEALKLKRRTENADTPWKKLKLGAYLSVWWTARLFKSLVGESFPSPFAVVDLIVIRQFRKRMVNSLDAFIKLQCVTTCKMQPFVEWRLGGSLRDQEEFERFIDIKRFAVDGPVGVSKTLMGKTIFYQVEWVRVYAKAVMHTDGTPYLKVLVREGPLMVLNHHTCSLEMPDWMKKAKLHRSGASKQNRPANNKGRRFVLPHPLCDGMSTKENPYVYNVVIKGSWGTRSLQFDSREIEPWVRPKTILRNFSPPYEEFCDMNGLTPKDLLKAQGTFSKNGIKQKKRLVVNIKGIREKQVDDLKKEWEEYQLKRKTLRSQGPAEQDAVLSIAIPVGVKAANGKIQQVRISPNIAFEDGGSRLRFEPPQQGDEANASNDNELSEKDFLEQQLAKMVVRNSKGKAKYHSGSKAVLKGPKRFGDLMLSGHDLVNSTDGGRIEAWAQNASEATHSAPGAASQDDEAVVTGTRRDAELDPLLLQDAPGAALEANDNGEGRESRVLWLGDDGVGDDGVGDDGVGDDGLDVDGDDVVDNDDDVEVDAGDRDDGDGEEGDESPEKTRHSVARSVFLGQNTRRSSSSSSGSSSASSDDDDVPALLASETPLAQFIRDNYVVTGNALNDLVSEPVFKALFKSYCRKQSLGKVEHVDPEELAQYGIRYHEEAFYDLYNVTVNERDLDSNLYTSNASFFFAQGALQVWLHIILIWVLPWPLVHMVLWQQSFYNDTTAVEPVLTLDAVLENPWSVYTHSIFTINKAVLVTCFSWVVFATIKLLLFYMGIASRSKIRAFMKTLFWIWAGLLLACTVSYVFMVAAWLILGAVIAPDTLLPYCTAVVTMFGHVQATLRRLADGFRRYHAIFAAIIAATFAAKIASAIGQPQTTKKLEPYPVFVQFSGEDETVDFHEFCTLLESLEIEMIEDRKRKLFNEADFDDSGSLSYVQFESIWRQLQEEVIMSKMREAGITKARMLAIFVYSVVVLCLLFAFIFIGVAAFVGQGVFGAVVNSSLVAFSGVAMNYGGRNEVREEEEEEDHA